MYTVYADDLLLYHPLLINDGYAIGNPTVTLEENRSGSFTFTLLPTNIMYNHLLKLKTIITVYDDGEEIFRGRILDDEKDFYNRKNVYCEGELSFFLDSIVRPYEFEGTLKQYVSYLLGIHNGQVEEAKQFKMGNVTVDYADETMYFGNADYSNTWDEINSQLIDYFGGRLDTRIGEDGGRYLDYLAENEELNSQTIEFGVNMVDITQYITAVDVVTRVIPLGAMDEEGNRLTIKDINGGRDYIENETGINLFGKITKVCIWDDVTDPNDLVEEAEYYLETNIEMAVTLKVKAVDLHLLNVDTSRIKKGDILRVLSPAHGLDSTFNCSKVVLKLQNPENNEYSLGSSYTTLTEKQTNTNKDITLTQDQINSIKDNAIKTDSIVKDVQDSITNIYNTIEGLDVDYAKIDFANIGIAAIEKLFADYGLIKDLTVVDGQILGTLTGVKITGDLIVGNTIVAESLILKGKDGLYYRLNEIGGHLTSEQLTDEQYQSALDGSNIVAKSITANKLSVETLSAISANIGDITAGSINIGAGNFIVTSDGILTAKGGDFEGNIEATSGTIGGFTIESDRLFNEDISAEIHFESGSVTEGDRYEYYDATLDFYGLSFGGNLRAFTTEYNAAGISYMGGEVANIYFDNLNLYIENSGPTLIKGSSVDITGDTSVTGILSADGTYHAIGYYRFNNEWYGFYPTHEDACNNTNRKGWMGHNKTTTFQIKNEADSGRTRFISSSGFALDYYGHKYDDNWTTGFFQPYQAGTALGTTSLRWYRVYSANSDSVSSDRRLKHDITYISDLPVTYSADSNGNNILEHIFDELKPSTYIMNADAKERIHIGFIAQDIAETLANVGLSENALDLVNHAYWTDEETGEEKEEYGLVYEQFIALNTHMIQKLNKKVKELETQLSILQSK